MKSLLLLLTFTPAFAFANPNYSRFAGSYKVVSVKYFENDQPASNPGWGAGIELYVRGDELCVKELKKDGFSSLHCMTEGTVQHDDDSQGYPGQILESATFTEDALNYTYTFAATNEPIYQQGKIVLQKSGNQYVMTSDYEEASSLDNYSESRQYVLEKN